MSTVDANAELIETGKENLNMKTFLNLPKVLNEVSRIIKLETKLLVSGQIPECSDCLLRSIEQ